MRTITRFAVLCMLVAGCSRSTDRAIKDADMKTSFALGPSDIADCRRSRTTAPGRRGGVTLLDREVVQYEIGASVHPWAEAACEGLQGMVRGRKDFLLDNRRARGAELCVLAKDVEVFLNGTRLAYRKVFRRVQGFSGIFPAKKFPKGHKMHYLNGKPFRDYWHGGWTRVPVPVRMLKKGMNTVVVRAEPKKKSRLLIETSLFPNRSAVSRDGGLTWDYDHLSRAGNVDGEYIIRLMLKRHPRAGWVEGERLDLWSHEPESPIAVPADILRVRLSTDAQLPSGTKVTLLGRLGPTPEYSPDTWTAWCSVSELARGRAGGRALSAGNYRFLQWRAELSASSDQLEAPRIKAVRVEASVRPRSVPAGRAIDSALLKQAAIVRSSHCFAHATNCERLTLLRKQCGLDGRVKGRRRGLAQLRALAAWIAKMKKAKELHNNRGTLGVETGWDGLLLWNTGRPGLTGRMCTHRAAFFVQCATALGYVARPSIWSHAIAEAWVDDLGKWVAIDPSDGMYLEVEGKPASHVEVSLSWAGKIDGRPPKEVRRCWLKKKSKPLGNVQLAWHSRFWVAMRSNYLDCPEPAEPGHGYSHFKYDGYLRWLHPHKKPLPWFANVTSRPGDFDFTVNSVNLHLSRSPKRGIVNVLIEATGPNLARCEARFGKGEWKEVEAAFDWELSAGVNSLEVRAVNSFDVPGRTVKAELRVGDQPAASASASTR